MARAAPLRSLSIPDLQELYRDLTGSSWSVLRADVEYQWLNKTIRRSRNVSISIDDRILHEDLEGEEAVELLENYTENGENVYDTGFRPGFLGRGMRDIEYTADIEVEGRCYLGSEEFPTEVGIVVEGEFPFRDYVSDP